MGTRSLTVFKDEHEEIVVMYRQFDGYPEAPGLGCELAEFLSGFKVVNGFGSERTKIANGMGCLAAQVIAKLKDGVGNIYLHPAGTRNCGEEYIYTIESKNGKVLMTCYDFSSKKNLFRSGSPEEFLDKYKE